MKIKEFGPSVVGEGEEAHVPGAPLDLPLNSLTIQFFAIKILPDF